MLPPSHQATEPVNPAFNRSTLRESTIDSPTGRPLDQQVTAPVAQLPPTPAEIDDSFELLRTLLFDEYRQQIAQMRHEVEQLQTLLDALDRQIQDEDALIETITPVIAGAIRTNISESRDEMVDALYPIMGKLVQRSVTEAMRDLAQRIDQQMRRTLDVQSLWRRLRGRLRGISDVEMAMRDALPLKVEQIFLIHRETGLLLLHLAQSGEANDDSDIISGMLTAINEFTEDAFGRREEESLNQIQYGGRSILLEAAHFVYIAVVIDGFDSSDFRNRMRETMIAIEHRHASSLRHYDGDAARFDMSKASLATLLT
jgi:hypothetical protein